MHRLFADLLDAAPQLGAGLDWKTSLQELSASRSLGVPEYRVTEEGPDHAKLFAAQVLLGGTPRGAGSGRTKKEAEQNAAAAAYTTLQADGDEGAALRSDGADCVDKSDGADGEVKSGGADGEVKSDGADHGAPGADRAAGDGSVGDPTPSPGA